MSNIRSFLFLLLPSAMLFVAAAQAQMTDNTQGPNNLHAGIHKSLAEEIGPGRGDVNRLGSSMCTITHDPFRSIRRGRQLFQRKFTHLQGQGPNDSDGLGDLNTNLALSAGLADSCALCHSSAS